MTDDPLARIVDLAYAAALDDSLWEHWAFESLRELGGRGGLFTVVDDYGSARSRTVHLWPGPRIMDEYLSGYDRIDPQLPVVTSLTRSSIYRDTDHLDLGNAETRDFTTWIRGHGGWHHTTAVALLGNGAERACLSLHYGRDEDSIATAQQKRLASVFPAFVHALELGFRQSELVSRAFWDGVTAMEEGRAAFLLNERGGIMRLNAAAEHLVEAREGLSYASGMLRCERPAEDATLAGVIAGAIRSHQPVAGAVRLTRKSGRLPLLVTVYPIVKARRMIAPLEAAAVMTILDPSDSPKIRPSLWKTAFALTGREAEFASLLTSGHSVESAATTLRMAIPTARTHLRSIFQKTGTDRQSGLLQLLARVN